jgi:hypothetical protein
MDFAQAAFGFVFVVGLSILVLLVGRELVCWYWKINAALEQLVRLEELLRSINQNIVVAAKQAERTQPPAAAA